MESGPPFAGLFGGRDPVPVIEEGITRGVFGAEFTVWVSKLADFHQVSALDDGTRLVLQVETGGLVTLAVGPFGAGDMADGHDTRTAEGVAAVLNKVKSAVDVALADYNAGRK